MTLDALRSLSPFGPIFGKELRATARRRRSYALRVFYLVALLLTLIFAWATVGFSGRSAGAAARTQAQAELGSVFFIAFSFFSVSAMAVIGPTLTATAIGSEKLAKTLPVLLMTPLTNWQIAAGKLSSRLLVAFTLLGLSLPVLAVVRLLGGVELWQMAAVLSLCVATVVFSASVALLYSTYMTRAYAVILMTYITQFALYAILPFFVVLSFITVRASRTLATEWLPAFNPFMAVGLVIEPRAGAMMRFTHWPWCVASHLLMAAAIAITTALAVRRIARRSGEPEAAPAEIAAMAPTEGTPSLKKARSRKERPTLDVSDHPIAWREIRRPLFVGKGGGRAATVICVFVLLLSYWFIHRAGYSSPLKEPEVQIGYAVVFNGLLWLLTAVVAATVAAQERESDTWTLLTALPLSGDAVVWGKVAGVLRRMMWPAIFVAAHFFVFTIARVLNVASFIFILWVTLTFNCVWLATGVHLSLRLRRPTTAVSINLLLGIAAYAITPMALAILGALIGTPDSRRLPDQTLWYLPYWYLIEYVSKQSHDYGNIRLPAGGGEVDRDGFATVALLAGLAHLALAYLILRWNAKRFDAIVERTPQLDPLPSPLPSVPSASG